MAVTGEQIFKLALNLMDEVKKDGSIGVAETQSYKAKSPSILTLLQTELLPDGTTASVVTDLADDLLLDDKLCLTAVPYGLAAHLMLTEGKSIASFFNQRFEELKRDIPIAQSQITDAYGVM